MRMPLTFSIHLYDAPAYCQGFETETGDDPQPYIGGNLILNPSPQYGEGLSFGSGWVASLQLYLRQPSALAEVAQRPRLARVWGEVGEGLSCSASTLDFPHKLRFG